jgi:hypothetical protein
MSGPRSKIDQQLDASLRRIDDALEHHRGHYAEMAERIADARGAAAAERLSATAVEIEGRIADKVQRRLETVQRREERRLRRRRPAARDDGADVPRGIVFTVVAIVCLLYAIRQPALFWMVFVALGFGMSAVSSFARAARRGRAAREEQPEPETDREAAGTAVPAAPAGNATAESPPSEPPDPKVVRIQSLCEKLLAELESGPPIVREVVTEPHATIGGLRQACVETAKRERELRRVLASQDESALVSERDALAARVSSERDAIVRDRLSQALRALEQQLANRAELATAATRLEAENTRILYTLENLHMQLLRARSTDVGAPELGGKLRESLRDLGTQIDAVAEALEWASAPAGAGPAEATLPASPGPAAADAATANQEDAQRAEREAAARRARAQQAQRR